MSGLDMDMVPASEQQYGTARASIPALASWVIAVPFKLSWQGAW